jgi:hypothetical protein
MKKEFKEDSSKRERRARRYKEILKENAQHMKLLRMLNSGDEDGAEGLNLDDGLEMGDEEGLGEYLGKPAEEMTYEEAMQELIALTNDLGGGSKRKKKRTSSQSSSEEEGEEDDYGEGRLNIEEGSEEEYDLE